MIATGYNFPDALAATPLAALNDAPILLTGSDTLHPSTAEEIRRLNATQAWLLGGTSALSDTVVGQLNALGVDTRRLAGTERIGTALAIADQVAADSPPTEVWLVTGTDFPDALTAGPTAGRTGQPLLLTGPDGCGCRMVDRAP